MYQKNKNIWVHLLSYDVENPNIVHNVVPFPW